VSTLAAAERLSGYVAEGPDLRRRACLSALLGVSCLSSTMAGATTSRAWPVAPGESLPQAVQQAADGDVIELLAGEHRGQSAVILQRSLTLRGVGGPVVMHADGQHAEGKALLVIRNGDVRIEGLEFRGARVLDANGAGIRFERGRLVVQRCGFFDNQMGLLSGNHPDAELQVLDCRFGAAPANLQSLAHLLYVGHIARLTVQGSRFSGGHRGHLLKSRARENHVLYNHLVDGPRGQASYELEFPNGGFARVVGNVLSQGRATRNLTMLAFGAEGMGGTAVPVGGPAGSAEVGNLVGSGRSQILLLAHNTWINHSPEPARFVRLHRLGLGQPLRVLAQNNLFIGAGGADLAWRDETLGNHALELAADAGYEMAAADETGLAGLPAFLRGKAVPAAQEQGWLLRPTGQFAAPAGVQPLAAGLQLTPGAHQP